MVEAVNSWADARTRYLNAQVAFTKRVLSGRSGILGAAVSTTATATAYAVDELDTFLTGK